MTVSIGEPKRNKDYHKAIFPKRTTDATESHAMARFAVVEQPPETTDVPDEFYVLREVAARALDLAATFQLQTQRNRE